MDPNDIVNDVPESSDEVVEEASPVQEQDDENTETEVDEEITVESSDPVTYTELLETVNTNLVTLHNDLNILTGVMLLVIAYVFAKMISNKITGR